jgi:hypothetical protein
MMCSEEDPLVCHRFIMNSAELCAWSVRPSHIRGDGTVESQDHAEDRLLIEAGFPDVASHSLFGGQGDRRAALEDAYDLQAARCAFRWQPAFQASGEEP